MWQKVLYNVRFVHPGRIALVLAIIAFYYASQLTLQAIAVPIWTTFTTENSELPNDVVSSLVVDKSGALWIATDSSNIARLDQDGRWETYPIGGQPVDLGGTLAVDTDNRLWIGSSEGLRRLDPDGHWQTYTRATTNGGLPDDRVSALMVDEDGVIWVGTFGSGLARLDRQGRWQTYTHENTKGALPANWVTALTIGHGGAIWIGTAGGLARLDKKGLWQTFTRESTHNGLPNNEITTLVVSQEDVLWIGTKVPGLARRNGDGHWRMYTHTTTKGNLPNEVVKELVVGQDDALWIATDSSGLARLDARDRWEAYTKANTNGALMTDVITGLVLGQDGALWVGTVGGLARFDRQGFWGNFTRASTNGGLANDAVSALAVGQEGVLWVGTNGGLAQRDGNGRWRTYTRANTKSGLPNDVVKELVVDKDGAPWVATVGGGLARLDPARNRWETYTRASTNGALSQNVITGLVVGHDGALWVGTDRGVARFDGAKQWRTYTHANTNGGLPNDHVAALAVDQDDALWVWTTDGLAELDRDGRWQRYVRANISGWLLPPVLSSNQKESFTNLMFGNYAVRKLVAGPANSLWVVFGHFIVRLDRDERAKRYSLVFFGDAGIGGQAAALAIQRGEFWIGGDGLRRLYRGSWQTYTRENTNSGLPENVVTALAVGRDGVWVGTAGAGVSSFTPPSQTPVQISEVLPKVGGDVSEADETVAVLAFDSSYLTQPEMFHYAWNVRADSALPAFESETITNKPYYRAHFTHEGHWSITVSAIDRYGNRSDPKVVTFSYKRQRAPNLWDRVVSAWPIIVGVLTTFYAMAFVMLLLLTKRYAWAFRVISDAVWAKWLTWPFFLLRNVHAVQRWVLEPWFVQQQRNFKAHGAVPFIDPLVSSATESRCEGTSLLERLHDERRIWLHGRSGMGKSSVFGAWQRAYFSEVSLTAAVSKYGFILVTLTVRHYADVKASEDRPESWVIEAVRRRLEQFGFATSDLSLVEAMLRAGQIAIALDGMNEADRSSALAAFSRQFNGTRLLVTSQSTPESNQSEMDADRWMVWELPKDIGEQRSRLLSLWLGERGGAILDRRIATEIQADTVVSGYDLRLIADLAEIDPEVAHLPPNRVELYRAILAHVNVDGEPLDLRGLKELAWLMMTQRQGRGRRRIEADDEKLVGSRILRCLIEKKPPIVRTIGSEREFRHDQMRAFLAALWLADESPSITALQKVATEARAFALNKQDQEELWRFLAPLLKSAEDIRELWRFANDDPERAWLTAALQSEADKREISLTRLARQANQAYN